jgi:hypothetical protein
VSSYPSYVDKFKESASYLKQLKDEQKSLDEVPRRCQEKQRELQDKIRRYVDRNDPSGLTEIPKLGREYGRPIVETLNQADRKKDELDRWRDRARNFSESDGRWSDVRSELHDAASEIFDYWKRKWEEARRECEPLLKEEKNPLVEEALKRLLEGEAGRQTLYKSMESEMRETESLLDDVDRDSSDSDVKSAEQNLDDIKRHLDTLRSARGEDPRANQIVNTWPDEVDKLKQAALVLDDEKDYQFLLDRGPGACERFDDELTRLAEDGVRASEDSQYDALKKLEDRANEIGSEVEEKLKKAEELARLVATLKARARSLASPSPD